MDRETYLSIVKGIRKGAFYRLQWKRQEAPAARYKGSVVLEKDFSAVVRGGGIDWSNFEAVKAEKGDAPTGPLPYGEYDDESDGTLIFTRDKVTGEPSKWYARVYINRVVSAHYFVNGEEVSREEYEQYLIPSKRNKPATLGKIANITLDYITDAGVSRTA